MPGNPESGPAEVVRAIRPGQAAQGLWTPAVGAETHGLLRTLLIPDDSRIRVRDEALSVLARCVPPGPPPRSTTGLVVGYVQSGKTMSFTTVAALARDNNFQLIIVIGGISTHLFEQSRNRIDRDLRIQVRADRKWQHFPNPSPRPNVIQNINGTLDSWRDENVPRALRESVLITVMKNPKRLDNVIEVLAGLNLNAINTLVVDDEADQAGLNTLVRDNDASPTYRRLLAIRQRLPHHTFLQYTATPQAPLLINLIDILSPSFAEVLTPGPDYVGGRDFFVDRPDLIRVIPPDEIPAKDAHLPEPPTSLLEAMRLFFLGASAGYELDEGEGNRSMMVHPSEKTMQHADYFAWVNAIKTNWLKTMELRDDEPDKRELVDEFTRSYGDLRMTVADLPPFECLLKLLPHSIKKTHVTLVNATKDGSKVDWRATYPHILVGGQAMDRGFTVEGLTVTYMPRGRGMGQADTIQQRARFFGYKRGYLNYCRVFLEAAVRDAYASYVRHEEDVRERLVNHRESGRPLSEWKRAFFLDLGLRPTRRCVLGLDYMQNRITDDWFISRSPHYSEAAAKSNQGVVREFLAQLDLQIDPGHPQRTQPQKHRYDPRVSLKFAYESLLARLSFPHPQDSQEFMGVMLQISSYLEANPESICSVYQMSQGQTRRREAGENDEIKALFQGEYPVEARRRGSIYPGDTRIRAQGGLTIQLHNLLIHDEEDRELARDVPAIALWIPGEMSRAWLVQNQGGAVQS